MLISHKERFIFVHIYKTAGTSVRDVFLPYSRLIDRMAYDFKCTRKLFAMIVSIMNWHDDGMKQFTGFHKHAKAYEIKEKLGGTIFDSYYTFAFVRNPFDLLVSLFFYIRQARGHVHHSMVRGMNFNEFLRWYIADPPTLQKDFVTEPCSGQRLVDYIGRFETLQKDVINIQEELGLDIVRSIKHKNPSTLRTRKNHREYYDQDTRSLVEGNFGADLDLFGYDFHGFSKRMPILED